MRIFILTKRQYMGKDLLDDRFGRFRELPLELNRLGHQVAGLAISYRPRTVGITMDHDLGRHGIVTWYAENAGGGVTPRLGKILRRALQVVRDFKPDIIWAASDAYIVTFGAWLAGRSRTRCVIDIYDNFESFRASKLPGILPLFRRAVRRADGVTCFSQRMTDHVTQKYRRVHKTVTIENGQRSELFLPRERSFCREYLGFPQEVSIIGTAGALQHSRGIETLFNAFEILKSRLDLHLAIAGPRKSSLRIPAGPAVHDLGILPHGEVPTFINALDVAVICYRNSPQGQVSFPQKAYEIIACRVPFVAAAVGSMNELLTGYQNCLYEPENANSLASAVERQLDQPVIVGLRAPSWADEARQLEAFFRDVLQSPTEHATSLPASSDHG